MAEGLSDSVAPRRGLRPRVSGAGGGLPSRSAERVEGGQERIGALLDRCDRPRRVVLHADLDEASGSPSKNRLGVLGTALPRNARAAARVSVSASLARVTPT